MTAEKSAWKDRVHVLITDSSVQILAKSIAVVTMRNKDEDDSDTISCDSDGEYDDSDVFVSYMLLIIPLQYLNKTIEAFSSETFSDDV